MGNGTSIGRVRGLGSAHEGAHHWLLQRFTAIGNLVLDGEFRGGGVIFIENIGEPPVTWTSVDDDGTGQPNDDGQEDDDDEQRVSFLVNYC